MVGKGLTPVAAYLAQDDIIRIALENDVDMIHPGYGFLSENAEFAKKVEAAGIAFIGPQPGVIDGLVRFSSLDIRGSTSAHPTLVILRAIL